MLKARARARDRASLWCVGGTLKMLPKVKALKMVPKVRAVRG